MLYIYFECLSSYSLFQIYNCVSQDRKNTSKDSEKNNFTILLTDWILFHLWLRHRKYLFLPFLQWANLPLEEWCPVTRACLVTPAWKAILEVEGSSVSSATTMTSAARAGSRAPRPPGTRPATPCSASSPGATPRSSSGARAPLGWNTNNLSLVHTAPKWDLQKHHYR